MDWVSLDLLGSSLFSQGGWFFPVKNKDSTSTVIYVPINQTWTYSILAHATLFGGDSPTEPVTLAAKFSTISADVQSEINEFNQTKIQKESVISNKTESIPEAKDTIQTDSSDIKQDKILEKGSFPTELLIGIGIGFAIGLAFVFITRRNPDK